MKKFSVKQKLKAFMAAALCVCMAASPLTAFAESLPEQEESILSDNFDELVRKAEEENKEQHPDDGGGGGIFFSNSRIQQSQIVVFFTGFVKLCRRVVVPAIPLHLCCTPSDSVHPVIIGCCALCPSTGPQHTEIYIHISGLLFLLHNDQHGLSVKGQLVGIRAAGFAGSCVRAVYDLAVSAAGQRRLQRRHAVGVAFQRRVDLLVVAVEFLHQNAVRLFPLGQLKIGCFVHR